ncbi:hypothetical protein JCM8097_006144 [Rhodosporidiobolus ruineniae]
MHSPSPDLPLSDTSSPLTSLASSRASSASPRASSPSHGPHQPDGDEEPKHHDEGMEAPADTSTSPIDASPTPGIPYKSASDSAPTSGFEQQQREQDELQLDFGSPSGFGEYAGAYVGMDGAAAEGMDGQRRDEGEGETELDLESEEREEGELGAEGSVVDTSKSPTDVVQERTTEPLVPLGVFDLTSPTASSAAPSANSHPSVAATGSASRSASADPAQPPLEPPRPSFGEYGEWRDGLLHAGPWPEAVKQEEEMGEWKGEWAGGRAPANETTLAARPRTRHDPPPIDRFAQRRSTPPPPSHALYVYTTSLGAHELGYVLIGRAGSTQKRIKDATGLADLSIIFHEDAQQTAAARFVGTATSIRRALELVDLVIYQEKWSGLGAEVKDYLREKRGFALPPADADAARAGLERQDGFWINYRYADGSMWRDSRLPTAGPPIHLAGPPRATSHEPRFAPIGGQAPYQQHGQHTGFFGPGPPPPGAIGGSRPLADTFSRPAPPPYTSSGPPPFPEQRHLGPPRYGPPPPPPAHPPRPCTANSSRSSGSFRPPLLGANGAFGEAERDHGWAGRGGGRSRGGTTESRGSYEPQRSRGRDGRDTRDERGRDDGKSRSERGGGRGRSRSRSYDRDRDRDRDRGREKPGRRKRSRSRTRSRSPRRRRTGQERSSRREEDEQSDLSPFTFEIPSAAAVHFLPTSPSFLFIEQTSGCDIQLSSGGGKGVNLCITGATSAERLRSVLADVEKAVRVEVEGWKAPSVSGGSAAFSSSPISTRSPETTFSSSPQHSRRRSSTSTSSMTAPTSAASPGVGFSGAGGGERPGWKPAFGDGRERDDDKGARGGTRGARMSPVASSSSVKDYGRKEDREGRDRGSRIEDPTRGRKEKRWEADEPYGPARSTTSSGSPIYHSSRRRTPSPSHSRSRSPYRRSLSPPSSSSYKRPDSPPPPPGWNAQPDRRVEVGGRRGGYGRDPRRGGAREYGGEYGRNGPQGGGRGRW